MTRVSLKIPKYLRVISSLGRYRTHAKEVAGSNRISSVFLFAVIFCCRRIKNYDANITKFVYCVKN